MLTDQQLQSLRNMGNKAEEAADEISRLRGELAKVTWQRNEANHKLAAKTAECKRLSSMIDHQRDEAIERERMLRAVLADTEAELAASKAEYERLRADAERYRWLRDPTTEVALVLDKRTGWVPPDESIPGVGGYYTYEYRAGEELDAAIDAARAGKGE